MFYLNLQISTGINVAEKNDKNNNDCEIILGKKSIGNKVPTNKLLEKSGKGNRSKPAINTQQFTIDPTLKKKIEEEEEEECLMCGS